MTLHSPLTADDSRFIPSRLFPSPNNLMTPLLAFANQLVQTIENMNNYLLQRISPQVLSLILNLFPFHVKLNFLYENVMNEMNKLELS